MKLGTIIRKGKRLTSFVKGSFLQAIATLEKRCEFSFIGGRTNIVLVPGAFCTSSVMNRLGKLLKKNGFNIFLPLDMPYFYGPLANTCPLRESARNFIRDVLYNL